MTVIGSARIDENGNAVGGKAGDQTLREVATENYYNHPLGWWVLRAKNITVSKKLAQAMKKACANDLIGYDQSNRESLYAQAMKVKFDPSKVTVACETDCSALVRVCLAYAGVMVGVFNTVTEVSVIMKTGEFDKLSCDPNDLYTGDILVTKKQGHTVIVTSGKARKKEEKEPAETVSKGDMYTVKEYGVVTAAWLNCRLLPGTENPCSKIVGPLPKGTKVGICQKVKAQDGSEWYFIKTGGGHYEYVSAKYIKLVQ